MSKNKTAWPQVITWILTIIAVVISGISGFYQLHQSNRYSDNTHMVLSNSARLAEYDIMVLRLKVNNSVPETLEYGQLKFQIDSLNQNLETIKSIDVTSLPKDDTINYQVYRQDLNGVIYMINSYIDGLRKDKQESADDTELLQTDKKHVQNFRNGMNTTLNVMEHDEDALNNGYSLYNINYKQAVAEMK